MPTTQIILHADVQGAFWWPIGEAWEKPGQQFDATAYEKRCIASDGSPQKLTLREMVDAFTMEHSGDSSTGVELADAWLEIRRTCAQRTVSRMFPLSAFPSVADYLAPDARA